MGKFVKVYDLESAVMKRDKAKEYQLWLIKDQMAASQSDYLERRINYLTARCDAYEEDYFMKEE